MHAPATVPPATGPASRAQMHAGTGVWVAVGLIAALAAVAQTLAVRAAHGSYVGGGWLWGADAYAFLPGAALGWALGAAATLAILAMRRVPAPAGAEGRPAAAMPRVRSPLVAVTGLIAAAAALWLLRTRHVLL